MRTAEEIKAQIKAEEIKAEEIKAEEPITTPLDFYIKRPKDQPVKVEQVEINWDSEVLDRDKDNFNKLSATEKEKYEEKASISLQQYQAVPRYSSRTLLMHPLHPVPHARLNASLSVPHSTQPSALAASACPV